MRVRLIVDLTKYDPHLVIGIEGYADLDKITYTDWEAEMVWCKFPKAQGLYVGWNGLEILSKQYWKDREKDVKESYQMEYVHGYRNGFKWVRVYSRNKKGQERIFTTDVKNIGMRLLEIAKENNIKYDTKIYMKEENKVYLES